MRNLKRALSLALASVMLLGMMVVGTSAASFPDVDDKDNVEAIEVLKAVNVMIGDNGYFKPDQNVTRNEMAVIMTNMLGLNAKDFAGACPFTDVSPWAQDYVAACYANGIIAGRSATVFDGQASVTAVEAAAMMMRALGYFKYTQDYEGGFVAATVKQAAAIRLFDGVEGNANDAMNRNNVAQLALNTLEADVVDANGSVGMDIDMGDGKKVNVGYNITYDPTPDNYGSGGYNYTNDTPTVIDGKNQKTHQMAYLQLCEKLYDGKLRKIGGANDDFGRPATQWRYKGEDIIAAAKQPVATFTSEMKEKDIFKELGASGINGSSARYVVMDEIWENGVKVGASQEIGTSGQFQADPSYGSNGYDQTVIIANGDSSNAAGFGNGISVELYEADKTNHYIMVIVKSAVAKVTNVVETKDKTTYTLNNGLGSFVDYVDEADEDKIVINGDVAKGDWVTCAVVKGVAYVWPTTTVTGSQTAKTDKNVITVEGEKYTVGTGVVNVNAADYANSTKKANYYIDRLGYVVKTDSTASTDYAYIIDVYAKADKSIDGTDLVVQVRAVLADGTVGVYDVQVEKDSGKTNWVLKDTNFALETVAHVNANPADVSGVATNLGTHTKVFGYTLDEKKISLEPLTGLPNNSTATANDTVYFSALGNVVKKDTTSYSPVTGGSHPKSVLADKDTAFVIYNADKKTTTVYTGAANLPKSVDDENTNAGGTGYAVLQTGTTSNVGTASVVFVYTATGITAEDTDDYVYIDATTWTETKDGSTTKYIYEFTRPDGTTGTTAAGDKIGTNSKADSGVYVLKSDNTVDKNRPTKTQYVNSAYSSTLTVDGNNSNLVKANGQWYNVDEAQIVYIDDSISTMNGNDGYVVLKVKDGTVTKTAETIFVVKAGDGATAPSTDASVSFVTGGPNANTATATVAGGTAPVAKVTVGSITTGTPNTGKITVGLYAGTATGAAANNDTIEFTLTPAAGATMALKAAVSGVAYDNATKKVTLTMTGGSWPSTAVLVVTAADGTTKTEYAIEVKNSDTRLGSLSSAAVKISSAAATDATASAALQADKTTVKVTVTKGGTTDTTVANTWTVELSAVDVLVTSGAIIYTGEYNESTSADAGAQTITFSTADTGSTWSADTQKLTVVAEDGSHVTYTFTCVTAS